MMQKTASFSRTRTESETKSPRYHRRFISAFMTTSNQSFRYVEPALTKKAVESAPQYTPQVSMLASAKKLTDSFVHRNNRQYRINSFKEGLSEGSIAITTYNLDSSLFFFCSPQKKAVDPPCHQVQFTLPGLNISQCTTAINMGFHYLEKIRRRGASEKKQDF